MLKKVCNDKLGTGNTRTAAEKWGEWQGPRETKTFEKKLEAIESSKKKEIQTKRGTTN